MEFNVDIREAAARNGSFDATCRETATQIKSSRNPESDMANALAAEGHEGSMQTWRGTAPGLHYRSVTRSITRER